jgi:hypothetical protein
MNPGRSLSECFELAKDSLMGGKALEKMKKLLEL